ncbi:AEC family transporter [bacterium]|nr:AEC family transporter [candidate division CSSED10-310 bacterium]
MPERALFIDGLYLSFEIIGEMGLLVLIGYFMVRRRWIGSQALTDLTRVLIDGVIPCAFILAMVRSFNLEVIRDGLVLVLMATAWILASWVFSAGWFRIFPSGSPSRDRAVTAMLMISNSIYLPLPVILAVTPAPLHDMATVYISITALPSIAIMWTVCVVLLSGKTRPSARERRRLILNAPMISLIIGILLTFVPGITEAARDEAGALIPLRMLFSVMEYLRQTLSPLAMLILGGFIASSRLAERFRIRYVAPLILIRLIGVPAVVYALIRSGRLGLPVLASTVLLLVAAAPPATNHSLIARKYNGEWELVSSLQLIVHAAALLTLPVWLSLGLAL